MAQALRRVTSGNLTSDETGRLKELMAAAFAGDEHGGFTDDDWQHALGGMHFLLEVDGSIACHASVVERTLRVAGTPLRTGYVEAVATEPALWGKGYASEVMRAVGAHLDEAGFQLGALGTGSHGFYERLGWQIWAGPSAVRLSDGREEPTPDEDGYIMVRRTQASPALDPTAPISCEWRPGDVW